MKKMKSLFLAVLFLILSCREPAGLLEKLEDDVMAANDLYLEVLSITPEENEQFLNPGTDIRVQFDRLIDAATLEGALSVIDSKDKVFGENSDRKSLSYDFDQDTNILTIMAVPYLDGLEQYTVSILDLVKGVDGSRLREPVSWSFTTNDDPRGYLDIVDEFTSDATVEVQIYSEGATFFALGTSEEGVTNSTDWVAIIQNPQTLTDVPVAALNGPTSLYIKFRDGMVNEARSANVSRIESAETIHDSIDPVISLNPDIQYFNQANASGAIKCVVTASATDSISGVNTYAWSLDAGAAGGLVFSAPAADSTIITPDADGDYTIRLTVTDKAGNSSSETKLITRDTSISAMSTSITSTTGYITDSTPAFTGIASPGTGETIQYRLNNTGNWYAYAAGSEPDLSYGDSIVDFRYLDVAGNSSNPSNDLSFFVYPNTTVPANGATLKSDIFWPYMAPDTNYYKFFISTSSSVIDNEISLDLKIKRMKPTVKASELGLLSYGTTYYWRYEVYNSSNELIYDSPLGGKIDPAYYFIGPRFRIY